MSDRPENENEDDDDFEEDTSEPEVSYNIVVTRFIGQDEDESLEIDRYGMLQEAWDDMEKMITKKGWNWDG